MAACEPSIPTDQTPGIPASSETFQTRFSAEEWRALVEQIQAGDDAGLERLYKLFGRGIRFYLCRQLGPQELDDKVHDTFLIVVNAIQRGDLREPERLMGFARTVVQRQVAAYIDDAVRARNREIELETGIQVSDRARNPEQQAIDAEKTALMSDVLSELSERDREILVRFYLKEQPQEQICREMSLTETQFRLLKSRAKEKFGEKGRKKLESKGLFSVFARGQGA